MNMSSEKTSRGMMLAALCCLSFLLAATEVAAQFVAQGMGRGSENALSVPLYKSRVVVLDAPANRISVGNAEIADILILRSTQLYVLGKDLGTTNVLLWDRNDRLIGTVAVEVTHDLQALKAKLHDLMPNEDISVYSAQRNIVLAGRVSNVANMNAAVRIAEGYFKKAEDKGSRGQGGETTYAAKNVSEDKIGEVINMLSVGGAQQVMLEVKVAEIARTELKRLDVRFNTILRRSDRWNVGGVNGGATFPDAEFEGSLRAPVWNSLADSPFGTIRDNNGAPFGPVLDEFAPNPMLIQDKGLFAGLLTKNFLFNLAFDAAKEKGLAKILAEPTLTTQTGQQAEFLSGGEFPIPVPQGNNGVTIEFKEFGVGVKFLPLVLDAGRINLKLNISVSELVDAGNLSLFADGSSQTFLIPRLTKRSAQATVELADGQTIGIAGLINENLRETVTKFPGLGDIPGIGALFRSQDFQKGESELLILVTPHLAKAVPPGQVRLPTDSYTEPTDMEFFLGGRGEGRSRSSADSASYGHDID